jgi:hypothetical protein
MPKHFRIAKAVRDRQGRAGRRIIFRSGFGKERNAAPDEGVRAQGRCRSRAFLISATPKGSSTTSRSSARKHHCGGVGPNRDASLVIWHKDANKYFAEVRIRLAERPTV